MGRLNPAFYHRGGGKLVSGADSVGQFTKDARVHEFDRSHLGPCLAECVGLLSLRIDTYLLVRASTNFCVKGKAMPAPDWENLDPDSVSVTFRYASHFLAGAPNSSVTGSHCPQDEQGEAD